MRDDRERLLDMLEAIERIDRYARGGREPFYADELIQVWVVHHLLILGEAVRGLTRGFRAAHPKISWKRFAAMRNVLVHEYFDIGLDEVWATVEHDLPQLRSQIAALAPPEAID